MSRPNDKYSTNLDNYSQHRNRNPDSAHHNSKPFDALFEVSPQINAPNLSKPSSNPYYTYDQGYEAKPKGKVPDFTKRADSRSGIEGAGSPFTTQENYAYELLFDLAGGSDGRLAGDRAVPFFQKSNLDSQILFKIWHMADSQKEGSLSLIGFKVAMKLVALAQAGRPLQLSNLRDVTPLPELEGVSLAALSRSNSQGNSNYSPFEPQFEVKKPPTPFDTLPQQKPATISLTDAQKYYRIFNKASFQQEFLDGNTVRDIMLKTKLSVELLKNIWTIADTQGRGYLEAFEFIVAMYYVENVMDGSLQDVPLRLPYSIRESAINAVAVLSRNSTPAPSHINQSSRNSPYSTYSGPISPSYPAEPRNRRPQFESGDHYSSQAGLGMGHYHSNSISSQGSVDPTPTLTSLNSQPPPPHRPAQLQAPVPVQKSPTPSQSTSNDEWGIALSDRAKYYSFFDNSVDDPTKSMSSSAAYNIFIKSNLPQNDLATIWELSDIQTQGSLSRDEFVVAMHLLYQRLMGKELPVTLPPSLVPPSLRVYKHDLEVPNPAQQFDNFMTSTINPLNSLQPNQVRVNQPEAARPISDLISFDPNAQDPKVLKEQELKNQSHSSYEAGNATHYHSAATNLPTLQNSLHENVYTPTSTNLPNLEQGQFSQHQFQQQNQQIAYPTKETTTLSSQIVQPIDQLNRQIDSAEEINPKKWDAGKAFEIQQYLQAAQPPNLAPASDKVESVDSQSGANDPFTAIIGSQQVDSFTAAQPSTNLYNKESNLTNQAVASESVNSNQGDQNQKKLSFDDLITSPTVNSNVPQPDPVQLPPQDTVPIADSFASFIASTASQPTATPAPAFPKPPTSAKPVKGLSLTSQGSLRGTSRTRKPSKENKVLSFDRIVNNHAKVEHGGTVLESDLQQDQPSQNQVNNVDPFLMAIQDNSKPSQANSLETQIDPFQATIQFESQPDKLNTPVTGLNDPLDTNQHTNHNDPFLAAISSKPELSSPTQQSDPFLAAISPKLELNSPIQQADPFLTAIDQKPQTDIPTKKEDPFLTAINNTSEINQSASKVDPFLIPSQAQPKTIESDPFLASINQKSEVDNQPQQEDPFLNVTTKASVTEAVIEEDPFLASINSKPETNQPTNQEDPFLATIANKSELSVNASQSDPFLSTINIDAQNTESHPFSPVSLPTNFQKGFSTNFTNQPQTKQDFMEISQDEPNLSTELERSQSAQLPLTAQLSESPQHTVRSFNDLKIGSKTAAPVDSKVPASLQNLFPGMNLDTTIAKDTTKPKQDEGKDEVLFDPNFHLQPSDLIGYFQTIESKLHNVEVTYVSNVDLNTKFNYTYDSTLGDFFDDFEPYTPLQSQPQTDLMENNISNHLPKPSINSLVSETTTAEPTTDNEDTWKTPSDSHPNSGSISNPVGQETEVNADPFTQLATQIESKKPIAEVDSDNNVNIAFGESSFIEGVDFTEGFGNDFHVNFPPIDDSTTLPITSPITTTNIPIQPKPEAEINQNTMESEFPQPTNNDTIATATNNTGEVNSNEFSFTPNSEAVVELLGMGFEEGSIYDALSMFDNDLSLATNFLLDQLHSNKN